MIDRTYPGPNPSTAYLEATRRREASEHRLANASRRAAPRGTRVRTRVGALLVRAGYTLGAPRPAA